MIDLIPIIVHHLNIAINAGYKYPLNVVVHSQHQAEWPDGKLIESVEAHPDLLPCRKWRSRFASANNDELVPFALTVQYHPGLTATIGKNAGETVVVTKTSVTIPEGVL